MRLLRDARSSGRYRSGNAMIPRLRQAFAGADYRVQSPAGAMVLKVGRRSPALALWYLQLGHSSSVLVTAWNPAGRRRALAANRAAEKRLRQRLRAWGVKGWPTVAQ